MKTSAAACAVACALIIGSAATWAYTPGTGITGTPHDFTQGTAGIEVLLWNSTNAQGTVTQVTTNTGVPYIDPATGKQATTRVQIGLCTNCHTPMQAQSTNLLWNHTLSSATYSWDQPATTAGTTYPVFRGDSYKGPSAKCMTCHDGTLANVDGAWFNRGTLTTSVAGAQAGHVVSSAGRISGNHPVAMPYPFNGVSSAYNRTFNGSQLSPRAFVSDPTAFGIRLFNDDGAGNITAGPASSRSGIECSSCHDVHNGSRTRDQFLLTGTRTGGKAQGYICTRCHAM